MADTAVTITAGIGTNIDTRTEATNGNHRQVVVLGDPSTNSGVAAVDSTAGLKVDLGADNDVVVTATDLDIRPLLNTDVVTAELSAVDNAVLDTIAAKDFATQTTLNAVNEKMVSGTDIGDVTINNASGASAVNIQDGGNTITVDGTVAVTNAGITTIAGAVAGTEMQVDVLTMPTVTVNAHAVTNAGTFATQVDGSALTALQLIDDAVFADDAAVTLGSSKGNIAEGVAVATDGTDPTAVSAEGDAAALRTDMNRLLIVNQTHPRFWHISATYTSAQTNASVKAAPGENLSIYITDIQISNASTAGSVTLLDGSGGTVLYTLFVAINGGAVLSLRSPIKLTANTALCITSTTVTVHSIFVSGYIAS